VASAAVDTGPIHAAGVYDARDLTKRYGSVAVLRGVSLTMQPGRVHTIMGENGAGKSTVFKILSGSRQRANCGSTISPCRSRLLLQRTMPGSIWSLRNRP
jgi:ABC-type Mn2+/Zn2+ transport system ATPase subunit